MEGIIIRFIQLDKSSKEHCDIFREIFATYLKEIGFEIELAKMTETEFAEKIIEVQGSREQLHLDLCYEEDELVGFISYAVDLGGLKDLIDPGYGLVMEFYVKPEKRRKGYGKIFYEHIESVFLNYKVEHVYLTPSEVGGEVFWESLDFEDSGKIDPYNKKKIYIKSCCQ